MTDRDTEQYFENNMTKYFVAKTDIPGTRVAKGSIVTVFCGQANAILPDGESIAFAFTPEFEAMVLAFNLEPARKAKWRRKDGTGENTVFKMSKSFLRDYEPVV